MTPPLEQASLPAFGNPASLPAPHSPKMRGSIRARLMVWNIVTVTVILAILGAVIQYSAQAILLSSVDHDLVIWDRTFAERPGPREPPPGPPPGGPGMDFSFDHGPPPDHMGPGRGPEGGPRFRPLNDRDLTERAKAAFWPRLLDPKGTSRFPVEGLRPWDQAAFLSALRGEGGFSTVTINDEQVRIFTKPLMREGQIDTVVQLPHPLTDMNKAVSGIRQTLLMMIPIALVLAGTGGALVTGRALRPVRQIVETAEQIGAHDLSHRLHVSGNDEFSHLAGTFNNVLARLEGTFAEQKSLVRKLEALLEQQRRFTADASHELKTPLTVIKANTSLSRQGSPPREDLLESMEEIDSAANRMDRLVQDLLFLAKGDAGQISGSPEEIVLMDALTQAIKRQSRTHGTQIEIAEFEPDATVTMDPDDLARVLDNLLDNAIRYTPEGASVTLSSMTHGSNVQISVGDTGPGVAPEHLPHLGERFYRADTSRSRNGGGAGLGLSICKSIAGRYGGSLTIESRVGQGTTVTVSIPSSS